MRCKYSTDEYEFMLIGWVTKIKLEEPQSITSRFMMSKDLQTDVTTTDTIIYCAQS